MADDRLKALDAAVRKHLWNGNCFCLSDYCCCKPSCIACFEHAEDGHKANCWIKDLLEDAR